MATFSSTFKEIQDEVIANCRLEEADRTRVKRWINQVYSRAVQETDALEKTGIAPLTDGDASYTMTSAIAQIKNLWIVYADGTTSRPLALRSLEELLEIRRQGALQGQLVDQPQYAVAGQNLIELWPTPDNGQSLEFWYVYLPNTLVDDEALHVLQEPYGTDILTYGACLHASDFKKDPALYTLYQPGFSAAMEAYKTFLSRRKTGGLQFVRTYPGNSFPIRLARDVDWVT